ncbi:MAG: pantoate--beta-alanine ligase [Muribaculaceae bacterium]|nr:pantoate--beta-alanine ligase [Muribaculaceae bacterium]
MEIIRTTVQLVEYISKVKERGLRIGLVPTMGALHDGHLSLVERSVADNDITVVSVFVNPTQFNNPADLATYPRDEQRDITLLAGAGASAVYLPTVEEVYPEGTSAAAGYKYDLGTAAEVMEGKMRPGHFQGVAQIVSRLFRLTRADVAYFGEKDFQQIAVIRNMIASEGIDIRIVACPIKRADDGLALSSRNALLTDDQRRRAPIIYRTLQSSVEYSMTHSVRETHHYVVSRLNDVEEMEVEYFEIVDGRTLLPVDDWRESRWIVGCITVYNGKVRLIDNIAYRKEN